MRDQARPAPERPRAARRSAPSVSAVVVNHLSAAECAECIGSLRACFTEARADGEIVLVDCASGPEEVERLSKLDADVFLPLPENRGYSGGINAGLARANSERLLLCNADVRLLPGALPPLLAAIAEPSVGAAAPLAFWDSGCRLRLPPGDPLEFFPELVRLAAGRFPALDARQFAAFGREAVSLWRSGGPARHLIGAVLAARREVFDRVGRFDERFPFEYEETEWEDRVRRTGLELRFVIESQIRHLWSVSASRSPETGARRRLSRTHYWKCRYGRLGRAILEAVSTRPGPLPPVRTLERPSVRARPGAWLAISPNPALFPFAGTPLDEDFDLPNEISATLPPGRLYFCVFSEVNGRPLETCVWEKAA